MPWTGMRNKVGSQIKPSDVVGVGHNLCETV